MKKIVVSFLAIVIQLTNVFGQEADLRDEFGYLYCDDMLARADALLGYLEKNRDSIAYILYYEGKIDSTFLNRKTGKVEVRWRYPRHGEGLNLTRAITFYLVEHRKVQKDRLRVISGGYGHKYRVQFWIAPKGAKPPKSEGTLIGKDVKFRGGEPPKVRDCEAAYDDL